MNNHEKSQYDIDIIHQIHSEIIQNSNSLSSKFENANELKNIILNNESLKSRLKKQLNTLKKENQTAHDEINELIKKRFQIDEQTQQIYNLIQVFQQNISYFIARDDRTIDAITEKKVENIVNKIVGNIKEEFQIDNTNDFENEFKKYCKLEKKIDDEISVLKKVDDDCIKENDNIVNLINDTENYNYDNKTKFQLFSEIPLKNNKIELNYLKSNIKCDDSNVKLLNDEFKKIVQTLQNNEDTKNAITSSQYSFLKKLEYILNNDKIDNNLQLVEQRILEKLKIMSQINELSPLTFQTLNSESERINLIEKISCQISSFYKILLENEKYKSYEQDIFNLSKENLQIPSYEFPKKLKYQEKPIQNDMLIELSEKLKEINEKTQQMIPLQVIKSLTSSFKESYLISANECNAEPIESQTLPTSTFEYQKNTKFNDTKEYEILRDSLESIIPKCYSKNLKKPQFTLQVPDFSQEINKNLELNINDNELLNEKNTNDTTEKLNFLLRAMLSTDLPPMPTFNRFNQINMTIPNIESINPILGVVDKYFEIDLYKKYLLITEINELTTKLRKLQNSYEENVETNSLDKINNEINTLNSKIETIQKNIEINQKRNLKVKNFKIEIEIIKDNLAKLPEITENIDSLKNEIKEKRAEIDKYKENWE